MMSAEKDLLKAVEPIVDLVVGLEKKVDAIVLKEGPRGENGHPGIDGKDGVDGRDGRDGADADPVEVAKALKADGKFVEGLKGEKGSDADPQAVAGILLQDSGFAEKVKGQDGVSIVGIKQFEGDGEAEIELSNGETITIELPRGEKGEPGRDGVNGLGIETKAWEPGVYREGSYVSHAIGKHYRAIRDTADAPGSSSDWVRVGDHGFEWCGVKQENREYTNGDLYIDNGTTFLFWEGKGYMFAKRGRDGKDGAKGQDGKDAADVIEIVGDGADLVFIKSDGSSNSVSMPFIGEILKRMTQLEEMLQARDEEIDQPIKRYAGLYKPGEDYRAGDTVTLGRGFYLCIKNDTNSQSITEDNWVRLAYNGIGGGGGGAVSMRGDRYRVGSDLAALSTSVASNGAMGYALDTKTVYIFDGTNWNPSGLSKVAIAPNLLVYSATAAQKEFVLGTKDINGNSYTLNVRSPEMVDVYSGTGRLVQGVDYTVDPATNKVVLTNAATAGQHITIEVFEEGLPLAPATPDLEHAMMWSPASGPYWGENRDRYRVVQTIADRDALTDKERVKGTLVWVADVEAGYIWSGTDWFEVFIGPPSNYANSASQVLLRMPKSTTSPAIKGGMIWEETSHIMGVTVSKATLDSLTAMYPERFGEGEVWYTESDGIFWKWDLATKAWVKSTGGGSTRIWTPGQSWKKGEICLAPWSAAFHTLKYDWNSLTLNNADSWSLFMCTADITAGAAPAAGDHVARDRMPPGQKVAERAMIEGGVDAGWTQEPIPNWAPLRLPTLHILNGDTALMEYFGGMGCRTQPIDGDMILVVHDDTSTLNPIGWVGKVHKFSWTRFLAGSIRPAAPTGGFSDRSSVPPASGWEFYHAIVDYDDDDGFHPYDNLKNYKQGDLVVYLDKLYRAPSGIGAGILPTAPNFQFLRITDSTTYPLNHPDMGMLVFSGMPSQDGTIQATVTINGVPVVQNVQVLRGDSPAMVADKFLKAWNANADLYGTTGALRWEAEAVPGNTNTIRIVPLTASPQEIASIVFGPLNVINGGTTPPWTEVSRSKSDFTSVSGIADMLAIPNEDSPVGHLVYVRATDTFYVRQQPGVPGVTPIVLDYHRIPKGGVLIVDDEYSLPDTSVPGEVQDGQIVVLRNDTYGGELNRVAVWDETNNEWRWVGSKNWCKADPDPTQGQDGARDGDLQLWNNPGDKSIEVYRGATSSWETIYSEDDVRRWIAEAGRFRGAAQNAGWGAIGATLLDDLVPENLLTIDMTGSYWVWTGEGDYTVHSGEIGSGRHVTNTPGGGARSFISNIDSARLNPGDWIMVANMGTQAVPNLRYVVIHGDILSASRAKNIWSFDNWTAGPYEEGSVVLYQGSLYKAVANVTVNNNDPLAEPNLWHKIDMGRGVISVNLDSALPTQGDTQQVYFVVDSAMNNHKPTLYHWSTKIGDWEEIDRHPLGPWRANVQYQAGEPVIENGKIYIAKLGTGTVNIPAKTGTIPTRLPVGSYIDYCQDWSKQRYISKHTRSDGATVADFVAFFKRINDTFIGTPGAGHTDIHVGDYMVNTSGAEISFYMPFNGANQLNEGGTSLIRIPPGASAMWTGIIGWLEWFPHEADWDQSSPMYNPGAEAGLGYVHGGVAITKADALITYNQKFLGIMQSLCQFKVTQDWHTNFGPRGPALVAIWAGLHIGESKAQQKNVVNVPPPVGTPVTNSAFWTDFAGQVGSGSNRVNLIDIVNSAGTGMGGFLQFGSPNWKQIKIDLTLELNDSRSAIAYQFDWHNADGTGVKLPLDQAMQSYPLNNTYYSNKAAAHTSKADNVLNDTFCFTWDRDDADWYMSGTAGSHCGQLTITLTKMSGAFISVKTSFQYQTWDATLAVVETFAKYSTTTLMQGRTDPAPNRIGIYPMQGGRLNMSGTVTVSE